MLSLSLLLLGLAAASRPAPLTLCQRAEILTRGQTYNFAAWTFSAFWFKAKQASLGLPSYLDRAARKRVVEDYFRLADDVLQTQAALQQVYSDPAVTNPDETSAYLQSRLDDLLQQQAQVQPLAEAVLEGQISAVLADEGLTFLGQPMPPVAAHMTPLPFDLVISPRDHIEQACAFMLRPDLNVDDFERLEAAADESLDVASLVVPIGGLGAYPTMVQRTANLQWTLETFAHEWTHNYLNWHPLGWRYDRSPALRTMNETTASISGQEISAQVLARDYPEKLSRPAHDDLQTVSLPTNHPDPRDWPRPVFDFRREMHATRVRVDALLAAGQIDAAEAYMRQRRQFFWWMGYHLRKLNQAYFAFYGAYADQPGGAAGEDPVGPAVRALRARSASLGEFIRQMAGLHDFEELQALLQNH